MSNKQSFLFIILFAHFSHTENPTFSGNTPLNGKIQATTKCMVINANSINAENCDEINQYELLFSGGYNGKIQRNDGDKMVCLNVNPTNMQLIVSKDGVCAEFIIQNNIIYYQVNEETIYMLFLQSDDSISFTMNHDLTIVFENLIEIPPPSIKSLAYNSNGSAPNNLTVSFYEKPVLNNLQIILFTSDPDNSYRTDLNIESLDQSIINFSDFNYLREFKIAFKDKTTGKTSPFFLQYQICYKPNCVGNDCFTTECQGSCAPPLVMNSNGICEKCLQESYYEYNTDSCVDCTGTNEYIDINGNCLICLEGENFYEDYCSPVTCAAGEFINESTNICEKCTDGYYIKPGNKECSKCPDGQISNSDNTDCSSCPAGQETLNNISCTACPSSLVSSNGEMCHYCENDTVPNGDNTECVSCPPGQETLFNEYCSSCNANLVSLNGEKCHACENGTVPNEDKTGCVSCPAGQETLDNISCSSCTGDLVSSNGETCHTCQTGTVPNADNTGCNQVLMEDEKADSCGNDTVPNEDNTGCVSCPAGQETLDNISCSACASNLVSLNGEKCHLCENYMIPNENNTECICGPGSITDGVGTCTPCPDGTISDGNSCSECADDFYPNENQSLCILDCKEEMIFNESLGQCECPEGYSLSNNECVKDDIEWWIWLVVAISIVVLVLVLSAIAFMMVKPEAKPDNVDYTYDDSINTSEDVNVNNVDIFLN